MDKQKQDKRIKHGKTGTRLFNIMSYTCAKQIAMNFYNAGYRKIPENAVVIPKEISVYDDIEKTVKVYKNDLGERVEFTNEQVMFLAQLYHFCENKTRKETTEKIVDWLKARARVNKTLDGYEIIDIDDINEVTKEFIGEKK